jgi:hypothetical protein
MPSAPKRRRRGGRRRRPFRQGDLDGLCGVYSVVNAVRHLCPEVDTETAWHVFDLLMQRLLRSASNPAGTVTSGIGRLMVARLINEAILYVRDDFDIRLKVRRLPKPLRVDGSRDQLWVALQDAIGPSCVAILGLTGKHSHWTVATHVSAANLRLFDSTQLRALPRARCTVGRTLKRHQLSPRHVLLVQRSA